MGRPRTKTNHSMIWNRVPKSCFIKYKQFATAIFDATAHFNIGNLATLMIYDKLDIERGILPLKVVLMIILCVLTMLVEKVVMNIKDAGNL